MTVTDDAPPDLAATVFSAWLAEFGAAMDDRDPARAAACVVDDGYWRDILSLTWDYRTHSGRVEIEPALKTAISDLRPRAVRPAPGRTPPRLVKRAARLVVEAFFDFDTTVGRGTGFVRLPLEDSDPLRSRAWLLLTTLQELRGFEEQIGDRRPTGVEYSENVAGDNWLDQRVKEQEYADRDPAVLIVGGGQSGLVLAARLRQFGVDALVVEKNERIGDNWRNRYHSLTLHNEVWANSLPYLPFPETWPTFLPKDKLAGWLEAYAEFMELNTWTGAEFVGADYSETEQRWTAHVRRADGTARAVRPTHLVLATGTVSGIAYRPELPGLGEFRGDVLHSSEFIGATEFQGTRALVVGTGNSGHDVAQELWNNGAAAVTMVQRNPTTVVSLVPSGTLVYALYSEGPPVEDMDLVTLAIPYPVLRDTYQHLTRRTSDYDKELLDRLRAAGFKTDFGPDDTGFHMKYLRSGGGYYINVGCSDLIADRRIGIVQADEVDRFTADALLLTDGRSIGADVVVLATGYENQQELVRRVLGDEIADKVGPIWGFDDNQFMRNMWTRTEQDHLWIMGGALNECRLYSRFLALLIKADLEGLLPARPRVPRPGWSATRGR